MGRDERDGVVRTDAARPVGRAPSIAMEAGRSRRAPAWRSAKIPVDIFASSKPGGFAVSRSAHVTRHAHPDCAYIVLFMQFQYVAGISALERGLRARV